MKDKIFNTCFTILFIIFIGLYISNRSGFYDYEAHKRVELTNEEIIKFEEDVKNNKEIDVESYLNNTKVDYSNGISKASLSFSNTTDEYIKRGINGVFKFIDKLLS